jgi:hypothetical protein
MPLLSWDDRHMSTKGQAFWLRCGGGREILTNELLRLALNHHLPHLCLLSSQDYRCEPPHQAHSTILKTTIPKVYDQRLNLGVNNALMSFRTFFEKNTL